VQNVKEHQGVQVQATDYRGLSSLAYFYRLATAASPCVSVIMAFTLQCKLAVNGSLKMESPDFVMVIMPLICFPTTTIPLADIKS
jgi:hypothetical protein